MDAILKVGDQRANFIKNGNSRQDQKKQFKRAKRQDVRHHYDQKSDSPQVSLPPQPGTIIS